ncbi:DUF3231 family protein [Robertmurraya kyonggiensis]|nr:DUF3231 family protein [Robertmurraya kyonggiensis]
MEEKNSQQLEKLTSAEMGKLWATYMGNSMSKWILTYFLRHVNDKDVKHLLEHALRLSEEFLETITRIFEIDTFPIPQGFTEEDVNLDAPRLFEDQFYVHYLKYASKAGMSLYNVAVPLMYRKDVKDFFIHTTYATIELIEEINNILMKKGFILKPPSIPVPEKVKWVEQDFLNGYFGHVRPMHALEVTHLYDNIENNIASKALILAFSQVAQQEKIRELFIRGTNMTQKAVETYMHYLGEASLPSPSFIDHLVTESTVPPFSDKLMLFHKVDMFSMKIRSFGNSAAVNGRHDIGFMYTRSLVNITLFVEDGVKIMINNGWMEQPPEVIDRKKLLSE